jgi:glycosyltransferase involved in cell wall biosynthesis
VEGRTAVKDSPQSAKSAQHGAVLIVSHDVIGSRMAGPGIRYWELAHVLAQHFPVILAAPGTVDLPASELELCSYDLEDPQSLDAALVRAAVVVLCGDVLQRFPALRDSQLPLVVDGYDPHTLETLALFAGAPEQEALHLAREQVLELQCRAGDFFLCASERQRDWWLGLLEATGRVNVHTYGQDPSLRRLVDTVPFGLPTSPLAHSQQVLKGVWPGVERKDRVILWGGGLWQWLDPLTAIRAMGRVQEERPDVKMVFPGTRHPNREAIPEMPVARQAMRLAEQLGLADRCVFFGDWVPYTQWPSYLSESDVAISLHLDTVETRLAFRSRVLDYVWSGLPMVLTRGDATSELVAAHGLGEIVDYGDAEMVARALLKLLDVAPSTLAGAFDQARQTLTWERAAAPLVVFCHNPQQAADKAVVARSRQGAVAGAQARAGGESGGLMAWLRRLGGRG